MTRFEAMPARRAFVLGALAFAGGARGAFARDRAGDDDGPDPCRGPGAAGQGVLAIRQEDFARFDVAQLKQLEAEIRKRAAIGHAVVIRGFSLKMTGALIRTILAASTRGDPGKDVIGRLQLLVRDMSGAGRMAGKRRGRLNRELATIDESIRNLDRQLARLADESRGTGGVDREFRNAAGWGLVGHRDMLNAYRYLVAFWLEDPIDGTACGVHTRTG